MAKSPLEIALEQVAEERGIPMEMVVATVEYAIAAAYRKEYGRPRQIIRAKLNLDDIGKSDMTQVFHVVPDEPQLNEEGEEIPFEEENQIKLADAKKINKDIEVEGEIVFPLEPKADFGRIAAQTAKQVIIQRLGEAEREVVYKEFKDKEGEVVNATVAQLEGRDVVVNIGKVQAYMPVREQVRNEYYRIGQRVKVLILGVEETGRGPRVIVSRAHPDFIKGLFKAEVPEIQLGTVTIEAIAREAGSRTKIAVTAHQEGLDPVGSCVGQRGIRVQAVLSELAEEKIDIILWSTDPQELLINSLSPAKVEELKINKKTKRAQVRVPEDQVSLAIGKGGQNVRLASKLSGWEIDIMKDGALVEEKKTEGATETSEELEGKEKDAKTKTKKEKETKKTSKKSKKDKKSKEIEKQGSEEETSEKTQDKKEEADEPLVEIGEVE